MRYQRISADCHLDMLWLPPDLFTSNASSKLRDLMPYVEKQADGTEVWTDKSGGPTGKLEELHQGALSRRAYSNCGL